MVIIGNTQVSNVNGVLPKRPPIANGGSELFRRMALSYDRIRNTDAQSNEESVSTLTTVAPFSVQPPTGE